MIRLNTEKPPESETIHQGIGRVIRDLVALVELQGQLFRSDAGEITERIARPVALFALGLLLLAATVPVCLLAVAEGLVAAGVPRAAAFASVAIAGMVAAAGMALWARRQFRRMPPAFARSREELAQNVTWIRDAVKDLAAKPKHPGNERG